MVILNILLVNNFFIQYINYHFLISYPPKSFLLYRADYNLTYLNHHDIISYDKVLNNYTFAHLKSRFYR